jgi:hypothetical protein
MSLVLTITINIYKQLWIYIMFVFAVANDVLAENRFTIVLFRSSLSCIYEVIMAII